MAPSSLSIRWPQMDQIHLDGPVNWIAWMTTGFLRHLVARPALTASSPIRRAYSGLKTVAPPRW